MNSKELQKKIDKEYKLFKVLEYNKAIDELTTKEMSNKEFDKQLDKLNKKLLV